MKITMNANYQANMNMYMSKKIVEKDKLGKNQLGQDYLKIKF